MSYSMAYRPIFGSGNLGISYDIVNQCGLHECCDATIMCGLHAECELCRRWHSAARRAKHERHAALRRVWITYVYVIARCHKTRHIGIAGCQLVNIHLTYWILCEVAQSACGDECKLPNCATRSPGGMRPRRGLIGKIDPGSPLFFKNGSRCTSVARRPDTVKFYKKGPLYEIYVA